MTDVCGSRPFDRDAVREAYDRDGFVVVRGLFTPTDILAAGAEADGLLVSHAHLKDVDNLRCRWRDDVTTGMCTFETFDPVCDIAPACRGLALAERLLDLLAAVYGEPACLFKDKLIYKPPGLAGYGLHQDWIAWPGFPRSFLTVLVPLDAADSHNGCTIVYPGLHHRGPLAPEDGDYHELAADLVGESRPTPLELDLGDVALFSGFTPHRSDANLSTRWRRQLYLSYNAFSDGGDRRDRHYAEFHEWLRVRYAAHGRASTYFA
ncbi:MAG: phytanoyl-CoA dioxygenase family protein [Planctomycetaceae bacterium]